MRKKTQKIAIGKMTKKDRMDSGDLGGDLSYPGCWRERVA